jgi:hypothetical protein
VQARSNVVGWRLRLYLQMSMGCAGQQAREEADRFWERPIRSVSERSETVPDAW